MVKMVLHEAFACSCAEGDVLLRQSYKPESCGKLYYACPKSKDIQHLQAVLQDLQRLQAILQDLQRLQTIGKISVLKATMEMHMYPEQHTANLAALFHEVLNKMKKLDLE
ncbi:hypothetical protein Tco_0132854 [Tanacetum coccineum]